MTLKLFSVNAIGGDAVSIVAAHSRLAARARVAEERLVPLASLEVSDQLAARRASFRCGNVRLDLALPAGHEGWWASATWRGKRRYFADLRGATPSEAARTALAVLLHHEDATDDDLLYEAGTERLHLAPEPLKA
jgi:hypothetical protein